MQYKVVKAIGLFGGCKSTQGRSFSRHSEALGLRRASQLRRGQSSLGFRKSASDEDAKINRRVGGCSPDYWTRRKRASGRDRTPKKPHVTVVECRAPPSLGALVWE